MTWSTSSTVDAFLISRLSDHNAFTQLLVCTYYLHSIFFPSKHTFPYVNNVHTPVLWRRFMVAFKVLNTLAVSFRLVLISIHLLQPIRQPNWTSSLSRILPIHPSGSCSSLILGVGQAVPPSHPPFLTVTPLALCCKHMLTITLPCDEEVVPMSRRTQRFRSLLSCLHSHDQWC